MHCGDRNAQKALVLALLSTTEKLKHSNIVRFIGFSELVNDGNLKLLIIMERANSDLKKIIDRTMLEISEVVNCIRQVLKALVCLHSQNPRIAHRDLKPSNILVFFEKNRITYKVADFGVSALVDHTTTGTFTGTELYMAPEVLMREKSNERADVFSLGVITWQLTSGLHPNIAGLTLKKEIIEEMKKNNWPIWEPTGRKHEELMHISKVSCEYDRKKRPDSKSILEKVNQIATTNAPFSSVAKLVAFSGDSVEMVTKDRPQETFCAKFCFKGHLFQKNIVELVLQVTTDSKGRTIGTDIRLPDDIKPENESTFEIEIIARSVNDIETLHKQYLECMHDHGAGKIRISISGRRKSIRFFRIHALSRHIIISTLSCDSWT